MGGQVSATGRTIEADCISSDLDDPKALARLEATAKKIADEGGIDIDAVRRVLAAVRAQKRKSKRAKGDFYETPEWVVDAIVGHLPIGGESVILDAGAGNGAIAARLAQINPKAEIVGVEKNPELVAKARARNLYSVEFVEADFLKGDAAWTITAPDLIIMNPPFSRAFEFIARARELVKRGGTVCALLRVNVVAGKCRAEFHRKHPSNMHVLSKRPSFTGHGRTDATEYAWFVWGPGEHARWSVLTHTDKSRRRPRAARANAEAA